MAALKAIRVAVWAAVVVLGAAVAWFAIPHGGANPIGGGLTTASIGGPFTLTDQTGATVTEASLQGHPSALFFGYTFCPDVCPTTLSDVTTWLGKLGTGGDKLKVYFVTVDPERDTRQQMASYLTAFDPRIVGLSGPRPAIDQIIKDYRVYAHKVGTGPDYTMDHTASIYLLDDKAQFVGTIDYQEKDAEVMAKLARLVGA